MSFGLNTTNDGVLKTTLGKTLVKSLKVKSQDIKEPTLIATNVKEISFAIVPANLNFYIDRVKEDRRLSIVGETSIEADITLAYISVPIETPDNINFELWIWE